MKIIEKEAKTKEDAIDLVLDEIGKENRDMISDIEIIENSKSRFFMFTHKTVSVKAMVLDQNERSLIILLKEILSKMGNAANSIKIAPGEPGHINVELDTEDVALLIGRRGKNLEAVQYLVNLIFNKNKAQKVKIILDIKKYREKRIQSLQKLAQNSALVVKKTRRDRILNPMNPFERKIIHSALQDDKDVTTESIGDGIFKQIKIKIKNSR